MRTAHVCPIGHIRVNDVFSLWFWNSVRRPPPVPSMMGTFLAEMLQGREHPRARALKCGGWSWPPEPPQLVPLYRQQPSVTCRVRADRRTLLTSVWTLDFRSLEQIQELQQRTPNLVPHPFGDGTEIAPEQLVVPREDLVDENVAVSRQSADSGRNAHS